jgi:hypothetical protein
MDFSVKGAGVMGGSKHNVVGDQATAASVALNKKGISSSCSVGGCHQQYETRQTKVHHSTILCVVWVWLWALPLNFCSLGVWAGVAAAWDATNTVKIKAMCFMF